MTGSTAPLASQSLADATRPSERLAPEPRQDLQRRRISYFMLVRLVILALFTLVAATLAWQRNQDFTALYHGFVWGTLMVGFGLTIVFARLLPRVRDLPRFAWIQTTTDIVLAAVVVQMSGGTDSGFVSLYPIAVLGAATMSGARQTWAAAGACTMIYGTTSACEALGILEPMSLGEPVRSLDQVEAAIAFGRTTAALLGVTVLSSFLDRQLTRSTRQVGDLRALNENILRSLSSGLIAIDNDREVIYYNPVARTILGLAEKDLRRPVTELLPGIDDALRTSVPDGRLSPGGRTELQVPTRDGLEVHVGLSCSPLRDGQGTPVGQLINFQDVTRVHELAEQVRRGERLAALGSMAASVAHEIRNPLAAISGSAELLGSAELGDEDARLLEIIRRESTRLSELVTDMLAFTRPRPPQLADVDLSRIARDAAENFRVDPTNTHVTVDLQLSDVPPVHADPAQLSQVLWNLLRNAAEAMDAKGTIRVGVRLRARESEVELSVADDGPGIPPERLDRIFDPFFTTKDAGTGFGLAIVHRVVQDNGGTIELSSTPGEGTVFQLRFTATASHTPSHTSGELPIAEPSGPVR